MNNHIEETLNLTEGESIRKACPKCGSKNTFTARKVDGSIIYNCYKLSCDLKGMVSTAMTMEEMQSYFKKPLIESHNDNKDLTTFVYPEHVVDGNTVQNGQMRRFIMRWPILKHENLMYDVKSKRAVFPIYNDGRLIDAIGRALDGAIPKWYRYGGIGSFYKRCISKPNGVYVIVEDVISAITVAKRMPGTTGFAILGTSLTEDHLADISDNSSSCLVALDPDALSKSMEFSKKIQLWTDLPAWVLHVEDDIKYERVNDINNLRIMIDGAIK
jgi:hypothetical protein